MSNVKRLLQQSDMSTFSEAEFLLALGEWEEEANIQYSQKQKEAIQQALCSPLFILTGDQAQEKRRSLTVSFIYSPSCTGYRLILLAMMRTSRSPFYLLLQLDEQRSE